jgi:hypothetical protein
VFDENFLDKLVGAAAGSILYALAFSPFDLWRWWRRDQ